MTPLVPNPLNQLARIGVGLLAIYWGVRGLLEVVSFVPLVAPTLIEGSGEHAWRGLLWPIGFSSLYVFLFAVVPALILYRARGVIAEHLAPVNDSSTPLAIRGSEALSIGCLLLAMSLALSGATGVLSAAMYAIVVSLLWHGEFDFTEDRMTLEYVGVIASAAISLVGAALLWRHARRVSGMLEA